MAPIQRDRLAALIGPAVAAAGYDLETVTVSQAGRRSLVRVVVDSDTGVSLDDIAAASKVVSAVLDEDGDGVTGMNPYVLEVTSPGVDRPLTEPRHWRRAAGRLVTVPVTGQGSVTGRVLRADEGGVVLDVAGTEREFGYAELGKGSVQVEFNRPAGATTGSADTDNADTDSADTDNADTDRPDRGEQQ
jgi:ribosome maturation factor RimP